MTKQYTVKEFKKIELHCCPKCKGTDLSISFNSGRSKMKVPYFWGSVKCKKCRHYVEATNPSKLIRVFKIKEEV